MMLLVPNEQQILQMHSGDTLHLKVESQGSGPLNASCGQVVFISQDARRHQQSGWSSYAD